MPSVPLTIALYDPSLLFRRFFAAFVGCGASAGAWRTLAKPKHNLLCFASVFVLMFPLLLSSLTTTHVGLARAARGSRSLFAVS